VETINAIVDGTKNILEFAKRKKIRKLVYLSSLEIYGAVLEDLLVDENYSGYINPLDVRSSYSLGKRMAECLCCSYCKEYGVPVTIARLTQSFGAGVSLDDNRVFAQFAKSIIKGENLELHTEGKSSKPYCYTVDVITAIITLLLYGKGGEAYNVANKTTYISIVDMAKFLVESFNSDCKVVVNKREDMGYAPTTLLKLDTSKIESLGWKTTYDLLDMFSQLIKYYKTKN
jgi:nucleoside-diphosphate-sugar epimerase